MEEPEQGLLGQVGAKAGKRGIAAGPDEWPLKLFHSNLVRTVLSFVLGIIDGEPSPSQCRRTISEHFEAAGQLHEPNPEPKFQKFLFFNKLRCSAVLVPFYFKGDFFLM